MRLDAVLARDLLAGGLPDHLAALEVCSAEYDSRRVEPGALFFAFAGQKADGRTYAADALARGAMAVVSDMPPPAGMEGAWIQVAHGRKAMALACRALSGDITGRLSLTGITGTNGKTTCGYLIDSVLRAAGHTTALIGTIEYHLAGERLPAVNTTPDSPDLYRLFKDLEQHGGRHVTMEVSSHALALGRVEGLRFHTAVFTNLTRDHLDFHHTMEAYLAAKRKLFEGQSAPPPRFSVVNADDAHAGELGRGEGRMTYGLSGAADVRAEGVESGFDGLSFDVVHPGGRFHVESRLAGRINIYNILAACGTGLSHGLSPDVIADGIARCVAVPGRFERVDVGQPFLVAVDYAHTDDALRNVIAVAREMKPKRVLTLFGCGGDRDRAKRPLMAAAACEASDLVVLTSDNPRSEDPISIMNDAMVGMLRFETPHIAEPDRERAIQRILTAAEPGDIVLLAGKGHETYQVLKDRTIAFDDREVARRVLQSFGYGRPRA
ncbi:MAG: UDP-N-acetylmuramoyl-L-alanyl-D-glutamate--2,6-diaminopimelate ligase [Acidobacteria bacterium]|nr:UDP-N-acetylmuramoyl-L-alanyl-D-glutamate--2,6-diaminopimelate ligase [Acidobacteriota bacterium]